MSLTSPEAIAREYGGNKKKIAEAARMGLLDPTAAVMAGMFIDKMRAAAAAEQTSATTVAQDVLGTPPAPMPTAMQSQAPAQGIPAAQLAAAPQGRPMPSMAQSMPQPMPQQGAQGLEALPAGDVGNFAGGGIVAFADGGMTDAEAQALGYSSAAEYEAFTRLYGGGRKMGETAPVPVGEMETIRQSLPLGQRDTRQYYANPYQEEVFRRYRENPNAGDITPEADNRGVVEQFAREAPEPSVRKSTIAPRGLMQSDVDLTTPFSRLPRPGETTRAMADTMATRQAVQDTMGLPAVLRGRPDLSTGFEAKRGSELPAARLPAISAPAAKAPLKEYIPDPEANLARAERQARKLVDVPKEETQAEAIDATRALYREMGVDPDIYKKHREILEKERGELKSDKEEARNMRLIEAGLGIMAGKSPHAFVNIGEGASPALKGLAQDIKDIKKADRELTRAQMSLDTVENQFKVDQSKSVQARMERSQDRVDKAKQTLATTTASLGSSLNALSGTMYGDMLRDLTARDVAAINLEGTKYQANKSFEASLAHAAVTRHGYDREERGIERIMKEKNVDYVTARGLYFDAKQRDFDRYNSIRTSVNKAERAVADDERMATYNNELRKLEKKPESERTEADKAKIQETKRRIKERRDEIYSDYKVTPESLRYLERTDAELADRPGPGQAAPPGAGGFIVNTPQGPISFQTKEQADAFRKQYNLP